MEPRTIVDLTLLGLLGQERVGPEEFMELNSMSVDEIIAKASAEVEKPAQFELMDRAAFGEFMHRATDEVARRHGQTLLTDAEIDAAFARYVRNGNGSIL